MPAIFSQPLREVGLYRLALEWIFHQGFAQVTSVEVAAYWHEHWPDQVGTDNESSMRQQASCFFNLVEAAGLGGYVMGRKGQVTRLEVAKEPLAQFIGDVEPEQITEDETEPHEEPGRRDDSMGASHSPGATQAVADARVFIAHSKNMAVVEQIQTMLDVSGLAYEVAEQEETTAIPVPDKVRGLMQHCTAAVICVTSDDTPDGPPERQRVNENVLIEIGAAFVLYEKRVVLVWDRRIPVPSNLQGLYRCEFEGDELSWSTGMRLLKAVARFRHAEEPPTT